MLSGSFPIDMETSFRRPGPGHAEEQNLLEFSFSIPWLSTACDWASLRSACVETFQIGLVRKRSRKANGKAPARRTPGLFQAV